MLSAREWCEILIPLVPAYNVETKKKISNLGLGNAMRLNSNLFSRRLGMVVGFTEHSKVKSYSFTLGRLQPDLSEVQRHSRRTGPMFWGRFSMLLISTCEEAMSLLGSPAA